MSLFDDPLIFESADTTALTQFLGFGGDSDAATGAQWGVVNVDPSVTGVAANLGSLAVRYTAGSVSAWLKTGAANTDWTPLGGADTGVVYTNTAQEALVGTVIGAATETAFAQGTYTVPAGTFKVGTLLRVRGKMVIPAGSVGATTVTSRVRVGGVAGVQTQICGPTDVVDGMEWQFDLSSIFHAVGATSDIVGLGVTTGATWLAAGANPLLDDGGPAAAVAINTAIANDIVATTSISAADATSCRLDYFSVEIWQPAA